MPELKPSANTSVNQLSQFIERIERLEEEKKALKEEKISKEDLEGMLKRLNEIHHRVGMLSSRFKSDLRKHFTYTTMHIMSMLPYYEN